MKYFPRLIRVLTVLLAAVAPAISSEPKAAITRETLWLLKQVGAPVPSPDGRWVVVPVTEPAYDEKDENADLWLVPADGSAPETLYDC